MHGEEIAFGRRLNLAQLFPCVVGKDREFIVERCIENGVGFFLKRENPGVFTAPHTGPHAQCFFRRYTAELLVTDNAPEQADIGGPDPVVVVQIQTGERRHKDTVD